MKATKISIGRWMDKKVVIHIHKEILLSSKKECIWVRSNEVVETEVYYTEWSKSERETSIQCINTYIWNLERCLDAHNDPICKTSKETQMWKQTFGLCGRKQGWDDLREQHWKVFIFICKMDDQYKFNAWSRALKAGALGQPRGIGWEGRWKRGSGLGEQICTHGWFMLMYDKNHQNIVK